MKFTGVYLIHSDLPIESSEKYLCWDVLTYDEFIKQDMDNYGYTYIEIFKDYLECNVLIINSMQYEKMMKILGEEE